MSVYSRVTLGLTLVLLLLSCAKQTPSTSMTQCQRDCSSELLTTVRISGEQAGFVKLGDEIMLWIVEKAPELDPGIRPLPRPAVRFVQHSRLQIGYSLPLDMFVKADYQRHNVGIIRLNEIWNYKTDVSVLVHEYVHHLQYRSGWSKGRCLDSLEIQAYALEMRWQMEHGYLDQQLMRDFSMLELKPCN